MHLECSPRSTPGTGIAHPVTLRQGLTDSEAVFQGLRS